MADAQKEQVVVKEKAKQKSGGGKTILLMAIFGCLIPFGVPTLLICLGLIPTVVALFTDADSHRSKLATIGYMNLAGVLPFLLELWQKGQSMEVATAIIRNPMSWAIMLGAAGIGHLILYAIPPMIASIIVINQEARLKVLRQGLQELEKIWGSDVGTMAPLDIVRHNKGV
ncbi:MAG: hypothetical protein PHD48_03560 [Alphaproteobacteria bacterium]|nr:hypothetical protein [Alphaproteobacteria bacterium]